MLNNDSRPYQSYEQCSRKPTESDPNPAEQPAGPDLDHAMVLEDAIAHQCFRDEGVFLYCPGCGDAINHLLTGLPADPVRLTATCLNCDTHLFRWATVAAPPASTNPHPDADSFPQLVQAFWEEKLRIGVADDTLYHTQEFIDAIQEYVDLWDWDWSVTCPLCDRSLDQINREYLDYHHWTYQQDIGTYLCRYCHDYVHGGDKTNANEQDWRAKKLGLAGFCDLAVMRLARRDRTIHDVDLSEQDSAYAHRLRARHNIPLPPERITTLVSEIQSQDAVAAVISEHGTSPSVPDHDIYPV